MVSVISNCISTCGLEEISDAIPLLAPICGVTRVFASSMTLQSSSQIAQAVRSYTDRD